MKRIGKRLLFWVTVLLFAGSLVYWLLTVPSHPAELFRAIPGNSSVISMHRDLANRLEDVAANPLTLSFARAAGLPDDAFSTLQDEETIQMLDWLASDESVIAYVPELGITGEDAWVFSSWIGGRAQILRWRSGELDEALRPMAIDAGWPAWLYPEPVDETGRYLALALVDGMVVGCVARDVAAIGEVLACYNGALPSMRERRDKQDMVSRVLSSTWDDRGWFTPWVPPDSDWYLSDIFVEYALAGDGHIEGAFLVNLPFDLPSQGSELPVPPVSATGPNPIISGVAAGPGLRVLMDPEWYDRTSEFLGLDREASPAAMSLAVLDDSFSGRLKTMKMPTLAIGWRRPADVTAEALVMRLLDMVNAEWNLGLVPVRETAGDMPYWIIDSIGGLNWYAALGRRERFVIAEFNDWMMMYSNLGGFQKLLSGTSPETGGVDGMVQVPDPAALAYLRTDLVTGGKAIRGALTAYTLMLMLNDAAGSRETRQIINEIKAWIEALGPLETLELWMTTVPGSAKVHFSSGIQ